MIAMPTRTQRAAYQGVAAQVAVVVAAAVRT